MKLWYWICKSPPALKPQTRFRNTGWASVESLCSLCVSVLPLRHSTPPEVFLLFLPDVPPHSPLTLLHPHPRPPLQRDREMNTVRSQPDHQTTNRQSDRFISDSLCRETKTNLLQILRVIKVVIRLKPAKSLNSTSDSSDLRLFTGAQRTSVSGSSQSKSCHYTTQKCRNMQQSSTQRLCDERPVTRLAAAGLKVCLEDLQTNMFSSSGMLSDGDRNYNKQTRDVRTEGGEKNLDSRGRDPIQTHSILHFPQCNCIIATALHSIQLKSLSLYSVRVVCLFLFVCVLSRTSSEHNTNVSSCFTCCRVRVTWWVTGRFSPEISETSAARLWLVCHELRSDVCSAHRTRTMKLCQTDQRWAELTMKLHEDDVTSRRFVQKLRDLLWCHFLFCWCSTSVQILWSYLKG